MHWNPRRLVEQSQGESHADNYDLRPFPPEVSSHGPARAQEAGRSATLEEVEQVCSLGRDLGASRERVIALARECRLSVVKAALQVAKERRVKSFRWVETTARDWSSSGGTPEQYLSERDRIDGQVNRWEAWRLERAS